MKRLAERPAPTHLRHWGDWLIYGLLRLFLLLPYPVLMWFGTGMGRVFRWLSASRRHVVETNLRMCFPEQGARARADMAKAHFEAMGRGLIEASLAWWGADRKLAARGEVVGLEHLDRALEQGGVILLTGHFTTLELAARYVAMQRPFHAMYRPLDNLFWDVVTTRAREAQSCRPSVPRRDLRALIKTLRQGGAVWYGSDQTLSHRNSAFVPFFGVQTLTLTATSRVSVRRVSLPVQDAQRRLAEGQSEGTAALSRLWPHRSWRPLVDAAAGRAHASGCRCPGEGRS